VELVVEDVDGDVAGALGAHLCGREGLWALEVVEQRAREA
jgi:hypothetical protein